MDFSAAGDFGLPHIDLNNISEQEMADLMSNFTRHQEVTTPNGTNCYAGDENQLPQYTNSEQIQASGQDVGFPQHQDDSSAQAMDTTQDPNPYHDAHQSNNGPEAAATPSHGHDTMAAVNAGPAHSRRASVGTPNSGTIVSTPQSGFNVGAPGGAFGNQNMNPGFNNNGGFRSERPDPYATPSHRPRGSQSRYQQPSVSEEVEIPDASDLFIAPVQPPPSMRPRVHSNAAPQGAPASGHHRRISVPNTHPNNVTAVTCPRAIFDAAESLIKSLEVICEETDNSIRILKEQTRCALQVYERCRSNPNTEEGRFHWDKYIGELRSQYDNVRDCMWGCVRYLVSRLSVWCKEYKAALPDEIFLRAVSALRLGKNLKVEIDKFRYPDWNTMAFARLAAHRNAANVNNGQQQQSQ